MCETRTRPLRLLVVAADGQQRPVGGERRLGVDARRGGEPAQVVALAAHQVVLQLWSFLALVLDSLAIAAQSLVGAALGGGDTRYATQVAWRVTKFSAITAVGLAAVLALGASVFPSLFTGDRAVLDAIGRGEAIACHAVATVLAR